jgi:hypothetical protein
MGYMVRKQVRMGGSLLLLVMLPAMAGCGEDSGSFNGPGPQAAALRLISIAPSSGATSSGTTITLNGAGFTADMTLTLGGTQTPVQIINAGVARATAPPHASGTVDVVVTRPDGNRAELANGFRYVDIAVSLAISGNTALQAAGETSQLTATATYSDGRTADVTRETAWSSGHSIVATVESTGVVTARGLGVGSISARHPVSGPSRSTSAQLTVTPAGSFAMTGRVREPGAGGLSGARVLHVESGQSGDSDRDGSVGLGGLTGGARLRISKDGYEDGETTGVPNGFFDAPIHRIVRLAAGAPAYSSRLAPNDVDLDVGGGARCQPCRLIRVTSPSPGAAEVTLSWSGQVPLRIWVDGQAFEPTAGATEIKAGITVGSGETLVIVGRPEAPQPPNYISFSVVVRQ